jgi:hypothetical protein
MAEPTEEEAWAEVLARWEDEGAHRQYLARFGDLDGLAAAGRRYRTALEEGRGDPIAARWREEVLKRAAVQGLASLPRTPPPRSARRALRWAILAALSAVVAIGLAVVGRLLSNLGARP